jgi:hypothetical protein
VIRLSFDFSIFHLYLCTCFLDFVKDNKPVPKQKLSDKFNAFCMNVLLDNIDAGNVDIALFHYYNFHDILH